MKFQKCRVVTQRTHWPTTHTRSLVLNKQRSTQRTTSTIENSYLHVVSGTLLTSDTQHWATGTSMNIQQTDLHLHRRKD